MITLVKTSTGWNAIHTDPIIIKLFGTNIIPTAFTEKANASTVLREIQNRNPKELVKLAN